MEDEKKIIVVVDDEDNIRSALKEVLSETYRVYDAADGVEALRLIRRIMPDVVILDILMPEADGYEVCTMLKQDKRTTHIPVIFLSAKAQINDTEKGFKCGGDAFVAKPFSAGKLLKKISEVIEIAEMRNSVLGVDWKNRKKTS
jgi:putative two-component system response regulator